MKASPERRLYLVVGVLAGGLTLLMWLGLQRPLSLAGVVVAWLLAANVLALGLYGYDKRQAKGSGRRVPEGLLHAVALVGGSAGAYAGMRLFRHKSIKGTFRVVFWLVVAVQLGLLIWFGWHWIR